MDLDSRSQSSSINPDYIMPSVQIVGLRYTLAQIMIQTIFEFDLGALTIQ